MSEQQQEQQQQSSPPQEKEQTPPSENKPEVSIADKALKVSTPIKKKRVKPPQPQYIADVRNEIAAVNAELKAMREEKRKRREEKEAARKKVTFREEAHSSGAENAEEEITQHAPQPELVAESEDEVDPTMPVEIEQSEDDDGSEEPYNPFARRMSRPLF